MRIGGQRAHRHRDIVALRAARRDEGDGPFDPGGMDGGLGGTVPDEDRNTATAGDLQGAGIRVLFDADHGNAELLQFLGQAQPDLSHADHDHVAKPRHGPPAEDGNVAPGEQVVDDAGGEKGGETHDQKCREGRPDEDEGVVRQDGGRDGGGRPGGIIESPQKIRVGQTDKGVGQDDGDQTRRAAEQDARSGVERSELPGQAAEHAPPAHGLGSAVRCHARAAARSLGDRNPRAEFRRRFPADRVGPRVDGPGDHGGNRNGGRREHDTSRDDAAQLGAGGEVEHGHEQTRIGTDMMDHEAVAQGLDVVVEQNGHPVDLLAQFGAQFGVGRFMQMDNRDPRGSEQRADAPTDIGAPNDHNASHAHGCADGAVMRKLGGSTHGRTAG